MTIKPIRTSVLALFFFILTLLLGSLGYKLVGSGGNKRGARFERFLSAPRMADPAVRGVREGATKKTKADFKKEKKIHPTSTVSRPSQMPKTRHTTKDIEKNIYHDNAKSQTMEGFRLARTGSGPVSPSVYKEVYSAWMASGGDNNTPIANIDLRIVKLRELYPLFQMKPIAVVDQSRYIDLESGDILDRAALNDYSGTVFEAASPWEKWGETLKRLHVSSKSSVTIRYYMYDFIKKAIFARAGKAKDWARDKGLISEESMETGLVIIGRGLRVQQAGGGEFAIFIPETIMASHGKEIRVPNAVFRHEEDISLLENHTLLNREAAK